MRKLLFSMVAALLTAVPGAAHAEWREYETAHFIIYSESDEKDVTELAVRLETVDGLMRMATGLGDAIDPVKVRIYEVDSDRDVERALGLSGSGVAGFYDSNILGPFAVTPRKTYFQKALFTPELVLHHEYAHHFMLQYFPAVYPPWYTEGFAELIGSSGFMKDGRIAYGEPAKHRGDQILQYWVSLDDLLLTPPHKLPYLDTYGQGWAITHYLTFSKERSPQLRQYLTALTMGRSREEAAKAFGDLRDLNRDARRYLDKGTFEYRPVEVKIERPAIQKSRPLTAAEAALIPETIAFRDEDLAAYRRENERSHEQNLREKNLARIREEAARYPSDPFALHLLAEAEYAAGNYPASEAAADRLLALRPNHVRAMVRKSINMAHAASALTGAAREAKAGEARRLAAKANRADPADPLPLLAYYQSFHLVGEKPPAIAVDGLAQAAQILPRDTRVRQLLVDQLATDRRWADAITVLAPIANAPHESPLRDAAREQMTKLQAELEKEGGTQASISPQPSGG